MNEVNPNLRPNFFPNSKSAKRQREQQALEIQRLKTLKRNTPDRTSEIQQNSSEHVKVNIPRKVKDFSTIKKAVHNAPDIDNTEKMARLKSQINNGTYQVDYDALADKLLESEF
jgi:negative regulator of flagellin synthesis FlgM